MKADFGRFGLHTLRRAWRGCAAGLAGAIQLFAGDVHLDMLKTRTGTFTNVTVVGQNKTDLFIRHARGIANVKISQVDDEAALRALGLYVEPPPEKSRSAAPAAAPVATALASVPGAKKIDPQIIQRAEAWLTETRAKVAAVRQPPWHVLALAGAALLGVHLFFSYCFKLICQKAGHPPGALIWLPMVQVLPLFRAARLSTWWLLGLLVPLFNVVVAVLWCLKIAKARGKTALTALALLLPGLNLLALLYLAFSDGAQKATEERVAVARESLVFET
ncbi:MAG: DUF5684 domain-containing protein [Verrucomicrobiae bacterium]|nr:DUF5684 domain-containing protein [Verrucomicrobiae bacterium]